MQKLELHEPGQQVSPLERWKGDFSAVNKSLTRSFSQQINKINVPGHCQQYLQQFSWPLQLSWQGQTLGWALQLPKIGI